jgi:hypothetical protein
MNDEENEGLGGASILTASGGAPPARKRRGKRVFIARSELPSDYEGETITLQRLEPVTKGGKVVGQKPIDEEGVTVTLVPLTPDEELEAAERGSGSNTRMQYELVKMAVRGFNGRPIDRSMMEQEDVLVKIGMRGRNLVIAALARMSNASAEGLARFDYFFRDEEV